MDNGLSPADISALTGNGINGGFNEMIWLFAIIALMGGGFGGYGFGNGNGNGNANAIQADVNRGFDNQNLQAQTRDILSAVTNGTAQTISASTANAQNAINAIKDGNAGVIREFGVVESAMTALGGKQQECCCNTLRAIDAANYNGAINTAQINSNIAQNRYEAALNTAAITEKAAENTQKILDAITGNRIADMQNQINSLQLQNATAGMLRFPQSWSYGAGPFPPIFGGCGCGQNI